MTAPRLTVLVAAKLHENQLERHLELFEHVPEVARVLVVRHEGMSERLSKVESHCFPSGSRPVEAARMASQLSRLIDQQNVDYVIGFNPVPWGSLAFLVAQRKKRPTCLSLIGRDYLQVQTTWGRPFLEAVKRAHAVTVTGEKMRTGLAERGVDPNKIFVLPHSVDVTRFRPKGGVPKYDLISIGQLIERKRMDVLIDALGIVARRGHRLRLGIVGRGNQEQSLREQVARLGLSEQVDFLGYRNDVEEVVRDARVFCLASAWEGVPFAMMEAMASGLVPVVTDVGTITDWVRDGENGRIVPVGNAAALADVLHELFVTEPETLERLATSVRDAQRELGFEQGAAVWRQVLELDGPRT